MFWFVTAILFAVAGIVCILIGFADSDFKWAWRIAGGLMVILFLPLFAVGGVKSVPTKSIGVPVEFGKIAGKPYTSGAHETWTPWLHLQVIDETIQTVTFEGCQGQFCSGKHDEHGRTIPPTGDSGSATYPCLEVKMGGQQAACIDVTIQWKVRDSAADLLFSDYANQGLLMPVISNAVVVRELRQVVNDKMATYNPIVDVSTNTQAGNSQFATFGPKILAAMKRDIGGRINVTSILWSLPRYDSTTQGRLNAIQQKYADTAIATQQIQTNKQLAKSYAELNAALSKNPLVLVSQCLDIIQTAEKDGYAHLPLSMGCIGSGANFAITGK